MHDRSAYDEAKHQENKKGSNLVWVKLREDSGVKLSSTYLAKIAAMNCRYIQLRIAAVMGIQELHQGAILLSSTRTPSEKLWLNRAPYWANLLPETC